MTTISKELRHTEINQEILGLLRSTNERLDLGLPLDQIELLCGPCIAKVKDLVTEFELLPKRLDEYLQQHVDVLSCIYFKSEPGSVLASLTSSCFYQLCVVRSYKHVVGFLSNDVSLGQTLILRIQNKGIGEFETYLLLLWLASFTMVPFPLENIRSGLLLFLYDVSIENLQKYGSASMTQKISAVLLSRLLTRSDGAEQLKMYLSTCCELWPEWDHGRKLGHLMALKLILKHSSSTAVAALAPEIYEKIVLMDLLAIKFHLDTLIPNTNILYIMGILSRLARFYLILADYQKVSGIVNNLINDILNPLSSRFDITLRETMAKCLSKIVSFLRLRAVNYAQQLIWFITKQLRIPELESRPTSYNPDLTIDSTNLSVTKYHTALLFYGFLGLNRVLHAEFVPILLSLTHKSLFLSYIKHSVIQGSQIRDASCFCLWALFRSLSQDDFKVLLTNKSMVHDTWADILRVLLCDEDYTIRRCALPVLQEFIGRFGPLLALSVESSEQQRRLLVERTTLLLDSDKALTGTDLVKCGYSALLMVPTLVDVLSSKEVSFGYYYRCSSLLVELIEAELNGDGFTVGLDVSQDGLEYQAVLYKSLQAGNLLCLLPLGGLLRSRKLDIQPFLLRLDTNLVLSHHSEFGHKVCHLYWYSSRLAADEGDIEAQEAFWALLVPVITNESSLKGDFKPVVLTSTDISSSIPILGEVFEDIRKRVKLGSVLIARQLPWKNLNEPQLQQMMLLVSDKTVDAETRAALIENNPRLTANGTTFTYKPEFPFLDLLDDYTLTNKGDVGLQIRFACLRHFQDHQGPIDDSVKYKLVRLAAESMDSVRSMAFSLLTGETYESVRPITYEEYFHKLFTFYGNLPEQHRPAFWEGVVHSVAGLKVSKALANLAFRQLLIWYDSALDSDRQEMISILLRQLKLAKPFPQLDQRTQKTLLATLNLFVKLFDASLAFPDQWNPNALFVRAYNLQLNAPAMRTALVLQIFHYLSVLPSEVTSKARQRVCQIYLQAKTPQIRRLAQETLFEIVNDLAPSNKTLLDFTEPSYKLTPKDCKVLETQLMCI